mgnify:CR=1 FL=1
MALPAMCCQSGLVVPFKRVRPPFDLVDGGLSGIPRNPGLCLGYTIRYVVGAERGHPGTSDIIKVA